MRALSYRLAASLPAALIMTAAIACARTPAPAPATVPATAPEQAAAPAVAPAPAPAPAHAPAQAPAPSTAADSAPSAAAVARPAQSATLPAGKDVIARYVAAIGGRNALVKHSSMRSTGTFEMPGAGLKGDVVLVQAKPNKMALTLNVAGMGEIVTAYNGTAGWSINPMQGPRVLEGQELAQLRDDASFESMLRSGPSIRSVETVEQGEMGGQPCYKVKVTYASGRQVMDCYGTETGLLVGSVTKQESPMGVVEVTTLVGDYKDFGGLKSATSMRQRMMGQEQVMTLTNIEYDRPEDAAAFDPPPAIRTMLKSAPKEGAPKQTQTPPKGRAPR
jgi:hypothetical protein